MPAKKTDIPDAPLLSENQIKKLTQYLKDSVAEHMRQQAEGILPYASRTPVVVVDVYHVGIILNKSRTTAYRFMKRVRAKLKKQDDELVSVSEFCKATGLPEWEVQKALNLRT